LPEDDAEVRRVSIANGGNRVRDIEITSYSELALAPLAADAAHPAFSKLFVQTEYVAKVGAILATRRRRSPAEPQIWRPIMQSSKAEALGKPEIETTEPGFSAAGAGSGGRSRVLDGRRLSNTVGTVLDPVFVLRQRVRVPAGATVHVAFWTSTGIVARERARPGGQASRAERLRTRIHAGLDSGAGAAAPSRHRCGRSQPVSTPRGPRAVRRCVDASLERHHRPRRGGRAALWAHGISGICDVLPADQ